MCFHLTDIFINTLFHVNVILIGVLGFLTMFNNGIQAQMGTVAVSGRNGGAMVDVASKNWGAMVVSASSPVPRSARICNDQPPSTTFRNAT